MILIVNVQTGKILICRRKGFVLVVRAAVIQLFLNAAVMIYAKYARGKMMVKMILKLIMFGAVRIIIIHYSLKDARINFEKYLVMYPPEKDTRIGGADSEKVRSFKRTLIAVFDKMIEEPSSEELNSLWKDVEKLEKSLRQDLSDSIKQYEAKIKA